MNPFSVDDRVQAKEKGRRNGTVVYVMCNECEACKQKNYTSCTALPSEKHKLLVSFNGKRYKYDPTELEVEPPLPIKPPQKTYDLSPKDIQPLGDVTIDIPLIEYELEEQKEEEVTEVASSQKQQSHSAAMRPVSGMFFDQFLTLGTTMERPI